MIRVLLPILFGLSVAASAEPARLAVTKGPVISGVGQREAWISWETSEPQGHGKACPSSDPVPRVRLFRNGDSFRHFSHVDPTCSRTHHVHLTHLAAGKSYSFTLDQPFQDGSPAQGRFETAPASKDADFSFVVYGDNREPPLPTQQTRPAHEAVSAAILKNEPKAAFLIHTGDLALNSAKTAGPDRGYQEFFDVERALLSSHPVYAVVGNHEALDMDEYDALVNAGSFTQGSKHPYYTSMDWGRAHFLFLDSFEGPPRGEGRDPGISDAQFAWIEQDLAAAHRAGQIIFIVTHQGPYSHVDAHSKGHGGSVLEQQKLVPLMRKYGVAAVFAGHDHFYEHGNEGCINYFVVGGGGAPMYEPDAKAPGVIKAVKATSYLVVDVHDGQITATAKGASGEAIDGPSPIEPQGPPACAGSAQSGTSTENSH